MSILINILSKQTPTRPTRTWLIRSTTLITVGTTSTSGRTSTSRGKVCVCRTVCWLLNAHMDAGGQHISTTMVTRPLNVPADAASVVKIPTLMGPGHDDRSGSLDNGEEGTVHNEVLAAKEEANTAQKDRSNDDSGGSTDGNSDKQYGGGYGGGGGYPYGGGFGGGYPGVYGGEYGYPTYYSKSFRVDYG